MTQPVLEMETRQTAEPTELKITTDTGLFERLAKDPSVSVEKLERLMALHERILARDAEAIYNVAMSHAQAEMRPVGADATNPQTRSRYASYEAIDRALRPIYTKYGFALSFNTADSPLPDHVRIVCDVTHVRGHGRSYRADMPADGKGAKGGDVMTKTHAVGSAMSYGMRYLLKMVFNIAIGEEDDDGNRAGDTTVTAAPDGFEDWILDMEATADGGISPLQVAFQKSPRQFKDYVTKHQAATWARIKGKAAKVVKKS